MNHIFVTLFLAIPEALRTVEACESDEFRLPVAC
jgi:hypothetical protein